MIQICLLIDNSAVPPVRGGRTEACGSQKKVFFFWSERIKCEENSVGGNECRGSEARRSTVQVL